MDKTEKVVDKQRIRDEFILNRMLETDIFSNNKISSENNKINSENVKTVKSNRNKIGKIDSSMNNSHSRMDESHHPVNIIE